MGRFGRCAGKFDQDKEKLSRPSRTMIKLKCSYLEAGHEIKPDEIAIVEGRK
jgi:hypothetical protein